MRQHEKGAELECWQGSFPGKTGERGLHSSSESGAHAISVTSSTQILKQKWVFWVTFADKEFKDSS